MQYLQENWEAILAIVTGVIATASAVAVLTPNATDNKVVALFSKLINLLALNVGKAKNKTKE